MKEASIRVLVAWGCSVITAWAFLYQGLKKILPGEAEIYQSKFVDWGYDPSFATPIGVVEVVAGILVLFPGLASVGACAAIVVMIGAAYTHVSTGIGSPAFAIIIGLIAAVLMVLRWPDSYLKKLFSK